MSWHPSDLMTDADLVAYDAGILTKFGVLDWQTRRAKVLEDWIWPQLRMAGFATERFRTRYTPDVVWGYTSSVYADLTSAATNTTTNDLNLATILASSSDALVIGSAQQFRGVSIRLHDSVSSVSSTLTAQLWCDTWKSVAATDGTALTVGKPFSKGGAMTWMVPSDWTLRTLSSTTPYYYARLLVSSAPTSATAGQVSVIRRSVLCAPITYKVLASIYREAPMNQDGPWADRATYYEQEAATAWQRALALVGGEFDADDPADDTLDAEDSAQTKDEAGRPFQLERA